MASFEIYGGKPLKGELIPQGAKNEALQVLCAPLLTAEKVTISNIPDIVDVNKLITLLQTMGVKVEKVEKGTYIFQAKDVDLDYLFPVCYAALFSVNKEAILDNSIDFYNNIMSIILYDIRNFIGNRKIDHGYFLERLWLVIFNYKKYNIAIKKILKKHKSKIIFEPGRSIVGNIGVLITKIIYIKNQLNHYISTTCTTVALTFGSFSNMLYNAYFKGTEHESGY